MAGRALAASDGKNLFRKEAQTAETGTRRTREFRGIQSGLHLLDFRYQRHYEAKSGESGHGSHRHGANGTDVMLPLPIGTIIKDEQTGEILADLISEGQTAIVAHGGKGGREIRICHLNQSSTEKI